MKVAYLLESEHAREILENMIIPQLEKGIHGADVVGMMFFFDNCYMLVEGNDIANRLAALSEKTGMLLMGCDRCCIQREIDKKLIAPAGIGCFPNVYAALGGVGVDQVITL
ncbi:MAG: sulfur reduction protein DsrE [Lachnospiraceae bacterium]|nr:sulfur reduction protein DsrE [Candidatus Equihabitans merdae]